VPSDDEKHKIELIDLKNINAAMIKFLETLYQFKPGFFNDPTNADHPAVKNWRLFNKLLGQDGERLSLRYPEQLDELQLIGQCMMDTSHIISATKGNLSKLKFGAIEKFDISVKRKIESQLLNKRGYGDLLVELYTGAWYDSRGYDVQFLEENNYPDLKVMVNGIDKPIFIECKRLYSGSRNRIRNEVRDANTQLKSAIGDDERSAYGIAVFDFSSYIPIIKMRNTAEIPYKISNEIIPFIEQSLKGYINKSVGAIIIMWDNYKIYDNIPAGLIFHYRRQIKVIHHPNPRLPLPSNIPLIDGWEIEIGLSFKSPSITYSSANPDYKIEFPKY
jgi:hypothetical protein